MYKNKMKYIRDLANYYALPIIQRYMLMRQVYKSTITRDQVEIMGKATFFASENAFSSNKKTYFFS